MSFLSNLSPQVKSRAWKLSVVVVLITAAYATGRYTTKPKTVEKVVTQTLVQDHVVTVEKVVTQTVYVKQVNKDVTTDTVVTKKPDGTVITEKKTSDQTKIGINEKQASSLSVDVTDVHTVESKTETLKITDATKQYHLRLDIGAGARFVGQLTPILSFGVGAERRIIGPFFGGLWVHSNLNFVSPGTPPYEITAGLSIGVEL